MFELSLENFRSFEKAKFSLSKINIIIGPNSAGKSNLIKWFLLLNQTTCANPRKFFRPKTDVLDLGRYQDTVFNNDVSQNIAATISFPEKQFRLDYLTRELIQYREIERTQEQTERLFSRNLHNSRQSEKEGEFWHKITDFKFRLSLKNNYLLDKISYAYKYEGSERIKVQIFYNKSGKHGENCSLELSSNEKVIFECKDVKIFKKKNFFIQPNWTDVFFRLKSEQFKNIASIGKHLPFVNSFNEFFYLFFQKIDYLGAFKVPPQRYYLVEEYEDETVGYRGEQIAKAITYARDIEGSSLDTELNNWVGKFYLGDTLKFSELQKGEYVSKFEVLKGKKEFNLVDVGFGTSQLLPILISVILNAKLDSHKTLLIEEPEVHLHPKAQASLADFFAEYSKNLRFIIETHSEHFLRKLQVLVATKKIRAEDISILYMSQPNSTATEVLPIKILDNGQLDKEIPSGFFDESATLIRELIKANI